MLWRRTSLALLALLWLATPAQAAVAFDNFTACTVTTDPGVCNHTPVGTPRGVLVLVYISDSGDEVNSCTYGGQAMTEVTGSPNLKTTGENNGVFAYFLGSSIPTLAQDASCDMTAAATRRMRVITLTGAADTEVVDSEAAAFNSDSIQDPTATLSLGGRASFAMIGGASGHQAVPNDIAPLSGWTAQEEVDVGVDGYFTYTYDTVGSADVTAGIDDGSADDITAIAIAISEVGGGGAPGCKNGLMLMGAGC